MRKFLLLLVFIGVFLTANVFAYDAQSLQVEGYNNYPRISQLEKRLFNYDYSSENIYNRISRLERTIFNQTYENKALSDRMDYIWSKVSMANTGEVADLPVTKFNLKDIGSLEKKVFGQTFDNLDVEDRLDNLDTQVLGAIQHDKVNVRINRLKFSLNSQMPNQWSSQVASADPLDPYVDQNGPSFIEMLLPFTTPVINKVFRKTSGIAPIRVYPNSYNAYPNNYANTYNPYNSYNPCSQGNIPFMTSGYGARGSNYTRSFLGPNIYDTYGTDYNQGTTINILD